MELDSLQEQMNKRALEDYVRNSMRQVISTSGDYDFATIPNTLWITRYTRLGEDAFSFDEHPYQQAILDDPAHRIYSMKSAQMGISEIMARLCVTLLCKHDRSKALYTLPTDDDVSIFSKTRIKPIFEDSPAITQWMEKTSTDNVTQKQIKSSFLLLRGGWEIKKMQMMDIDFLFIDELDRQKPDVIGSMRTRMDHSKYRYEYGYSTPTVEDYGIHQLYKQTDQKEWFITCTRCGERQFITYEHIMWYPKDEEKTNAYYGCIKCKAKLNPLHGEWGATAKGTFGSGYHITQAMSPRQSAQEVFEKRGSVYILDSDYWNYVWGLPYKATATDPTASVDYDAIVGDWTAYEGERSGGEHIMAIDWGHPWSWAEIRKIDYATGTCKVVWLEAFKSDVPGDHPERMIELARNHECGMVVGDIGFSNSHGYTMKEVLGDIFWDISSNCTGVIEPQFDRKIHRIKCLKERILKRHFILLGNQRIEIPKITPVIESGKNKSSATQLWIEHHKNIKIRKDRDGKEEVVSSGPDHWALTSAYDDLAFEYQLKLRASSTRRSSRQIQVSRVGGSSR